MHNGKVGHVDNVKAVSGGYHTLINGPRSGAQSSGTVGHLNRGVEGLQPAALVQIHSQKGGCSQRQGSCSRALGKESLK